jgi:hypothetical protein
MTSLGECADVAQLFQGDRYTHLFNQ